MWKFDGQRGPSTHHPHVVHGSTDFGVLRWLQEIWVHQSEGLWADKPSLRHNDQDRS